MKKSSNNLVKTIFFIIIIAIVCLAYFGLGGTDRKAVEIVGFSFVIFSLVILYLAVILSSIFEKNKKNSSALISDSAIYLIASTFLNFVIKLDVMKDLIIWNVIIFLVFTLIIMMDTVVKKEKR